PANVEALDAGRCCPSISSPLPGKREPLINIMLCCHRKKELFIYDPFRLASRHRLVQSFTKEAGMRAPGQLLLVGLLCLLVPAAHAQSFTSGPVKFIRPIAPGSATELA